MSFFLKSWAKGLVLTGFLILQIGFVACRDKIDNDVILAASTRVIEFSGYDWVVRTNDENMAGPGPNYFSDSEDNVWVDEDGRLHLKIIERGGNWYCSGVTLRRPLGYKKYVVYVGSRVDQLDQNVVAGLFLYRTDEEEIDIEFSRWGNPENMDSQFAVQPSYKAGNKTRYNLNLQSPYSTHFFHWQVTQIDFGSYHGHTLEPTEENVIHEWSYTGLDIPPASDARFKLNLWLFRGNGPSDNKEAEIIIDKVEFY